jgi:hypothetical protein
MGNETSTEDLGPIKSSYSTLNLNNKKLLTNSNSFNMDVMNKRKKSSSTLSLTNQLLNNKYELSDKCLKNFFNGTK